MKNLISTLLLMVTITGCQAGDTNSENVNHSDSIKLHIDMDSYIDDFSQSQPTRTIQFNIRIFADDGVSKSQIIVNPNDEFEITIDGFTYDLNQQFDQTSSLTGFSRYSAKLNNVDKDIKKVSVRLKIHTGVYQATYTIPKSLKVNNYSKRSMMFNPMYDAIDLSWIAESHPSKVRVVHELYAKSSSSKCSTLDNEYLVQYHENSVFINPGFTQASCAQADNIEKVKTEVTLSTDNESLHWDYRSFDKSSFSYQETYTWKNEWTAP
ncbi:hypothetical protein [Thalassomonas sp. M1454]|uniref:hypothetical protein n=1 Tax=Thalassomonas sp. M1454 TaxID=2594477 RepID=UPI00117F14FA|nr:hypothetical protein [Thalassomonas sp. M1454]TRX57108.1 hypothetical protein FNN08_06310 [Thalassomonas sp. M1454]